MTSPSASLLEVRGLTRRFGARTVFEHVSFALARGEIVSLVGPSGCGKSTLLRAIAGLDARTDGSVLLERQPQRGPSDRIGMIFQEPRLLPWLSVANNIAFAAGSRRGNDPRVDALVAEVGLPGIGDALPKQLSGGMAQRVALARGLFAEPDLLLLDEPFSAVDAITRARLQRVLLALTQAHGTTALLIRHDLDEALHLSDRVLVLSPAGDDRPSRIARDIRIDATRPRDLRDPAMNALRDTLLEGIAITAV
ncbi:ABC transporter ATP-binding protein [Paraburkholderia caribensis]|uniref:ABC transporter ATP-binding protein n=1 Tax=Paraburkholderia caribensis TaxID=75105 RepID=A0A9Q6S716_9BURK|nr:ABC transporter ATP-binding protein [Paraburkholderia caribensis]MCO4880113.1 ABC transporter ATP-binding protein [Paraburkholderia caribensis]PTB26264.1 ABC transporter ATP-binding protein [Paraburkholderia caribensis]QLB66117.1 sulfonate ABC transporter ATP-binding protein [Paraburkholderia caribensis]